MTPEETVRRFWQHLYYVFKEPRAEVDERQVRNLLEAMKSMPQDEDTKLLMREVEKGEWPEVLKRLSVFVRRLGVKVQEEEFEEWTGDKLSVLFPKTWEYLKVYIPFRWPEHLDGHLPDIAVRAVSYKPGYNYSVATFAYAKPPFIKICLEHFRPRRAPMTLDEAKQVIRYIDSMPKYQTSVIHEYEHYMQYLHRRDNFPKHHAFQYIKRVFAEDSKVRKFLEKSERIAYILSDMEGDLNTEELAANLAEVIYWKVAGYDERSIVRMHQQIFPNTFRQKVAEIKKKLQEKDLDKKQRKKLKFMLVVLKRMIRPTEHLWAEADRVAAQIRHKLA